MIFVFLPPSAYTEQQWEVLGSIMRLLPHAVAQLKLVFQSHNKVDFTEVAQGALRALGDARDAYRSCTRARLSYSALIDRRVSGYIDQSI